jgi:hypothetical protein
MWWIVEKELEWLEKQGMGPECILERNRWWASGKSFGDLPSFDWSCFGICDSAERIKEARWCCGERGNALFSAEF